MIASDWTGLLLGLVVALVLAALATVGLRAERYRCAQDCRFRCPRFGTDADCELVQDVRIGQWKDVRSCSVFAGAESVPCDRDCLRRLNLGLPLAEWQQRYARSWSVPAHPPGLPN